jgi:predicted RNA-binding protein YlxR (DUF448 family)
MLDSVSQSASVRAGLARGHATLPAPLLRMCTSCRKPAPADILVRMQAGVLPSSSLHVSGGRTRRRPIHGRSTYVHALESCFKRMLWRRPLALEGRAADEVAGALSVFFANEVAFANNCVVAASEPSNEAPFSQGAHLSWLREGLRALEAARQSIRVNQKKGAK